MHRTWDRGIALYLAPTNFVRDRLLDGGVPAERVRVRPHFVEDPGERAAPPSQSRIILYVGRLSEDKGAHVLFDAWSSFGDTGLELVCVGEGPLREEIARRNIPSVRLMGALAPADVRDWMLRARVLVAPSTWYETFGLVVAEAMAAALPVIVPRIGALAEVAAGGAAVAHTEFADVRSLNNDLVAALQVARDDGLIDVAGKSGRARFSATFTPAAGLARLMDAYRHAIRSNADAATAPVSAGNE